MRFDTVILGAGAAGMMCAAHAGRRTLVVDHARKPGEKIRISGGGRCNFTNLYAGPENFLSENPHFAKSALARYSQWDFIDLVGRHGIAWHEKTLGQLFCDGSATEIIAMLQAEMTRAGAEMWLETSFKSVVRRGDGFVLSLERAGKAVSVEARHVVVATGGKSIPKMGASGLAYDIARQFGVPVTETRPALVPFTFPEGRFRPLAGVSATGRISNARATFDEAVLFTHRGLSGPAVLQISSYWREGEAVALNLIPDGTLFETLRSQRQKRGGHDLVTELGRHLPARLVAALATDRDFAAPLSGRLADQSDAALRALCDALAHWSLTPSGTEGYRTAEVTLGGIATDALSARDMECRAVPGLYFIGEAVDVTGWLGGFNFQWAWSSGVAAGRAIGSAQE